MNKIANQVIVISFIALLSSCIPSPMTPKYSSISEGPISYISFEGPHGTAYEMFKCRDVSKRNSLGEVRITPGSPNTITVVANKPLLVRADFQELKSLDYHIFVTKHGTSSGFTMTIEQAKIYLSFIPKENIDYVIYSEINTINDSKVMQSNVSQKSGNTTKKLPSEAKYMQTSYASEELFQSVVPIWPECK